MKVWVTIMAVYECTGYMAVNIRGDLHDLDSLKNVKVNECDIAYSLNILKSSILEYVMGGYTPLYHSWAGL